MRSEEILKHTFAQNRISSLISGIAFFAFALTPTVAGVIRLLIYISILLVFVFQKRNEELWTKPSSERFFEAAVLNVVLLIRFCISLSPSSKVAELALRIGLRPGLLLFIAGSVICVLSLPFSARLICLLLSFLGLAQGGDDAVEKTISSASFYRLCIIFAIIAIIVMCAACFGANVWADEAFTLRMIQHSYSEIITLTAADVHPPLYYLLLKAVSSVFTVILPGRWDAVYAGKLFSVLTQTLLLTVCGKIRRQWGNYVAGLWVVCVAGMNPMPQYATEIRMYGLAMLLVFLVYIYANEIMQTATIRSWLFFVVFGLAAAYTHYYACISVGVVYLMLLLWFLNNDRKELRHWFVAAAATLLLYLPWLMVLYRQVRTISSDYWIEPITLTDFSYYFASLFGTLFFELFCLYLCLNEYQKKRNTILNDGVSVYALGGILIPIGTMLIGIIVSIVFRPVFVSRYLVPGIASMWLGMMIMCMYQKQKIAKRLMMLFVLFGALTNITGFVEAEYDIFQRSAETTSFLANNKNAVYVTDNWHMAQNFEVLSDTNCYLWREEIAAVYRPVYRNLKSMYGEAEIRAILDDGREVFFIDYSDSKSEGALIDDLLLPGVTVSRDLGRFWMEQELQVYQIVYER